MLLGAPLVAAAQVLVYIGAISVLILFAIMLTQTKAGPARLVFHHQAWAAARRRDRSLADRHRDRVIATDWPLPSASACTTATRRRSRGCCSTSYVLPFEIVSVLLLAAVIGGVFLAKREDGRSGRPSERRARRPPLEGPSS